MRSAARLLGEESTMVELAEGREARTQPRLQARLERDVYLDRICFADITLVRSTSQASNVVLKVA